MPDLRERFGSFARTNAPDLWPEILEREPLHRAPAPRGPRVVAAAVALVVAAAGFAGIAIALRRADEANGPARETPSPVVPVSRGNGPIYFRVGGGDGGSRIEAVEPDGSDRRVVFDGEPARIAQIAWSPDGSRIAYLNPIADERGIYVANADGSDVSRLTDGPNDAWPSWSPDGTRIVFSSSRDDASIDRCTPAGADFACPTDIYAMDADGSNVTRLTSDPAPEYQPAWSPDGGRIAFVRTVHHETPGEIFDAPAIFTMAPDGGGVAQVSSGDGGSDFSPSWAADGSQIAFAAIRSEDWGIWVVDADGTDEQRILGGVGAWYAEDPVWSPDGALIAFVGNPISGDYSPEDALYVMRPDGSDVRLVAEAADRSVAGDIAWRPAAVAAETGSPTPEPATGAEVAGTFEVGRDVRSVAYGAGSVWVATSGDDGTSEGRIVRIDPATHDVQAEIPVDVIPTWEVGGGAMLVHEGVLWITGGLGRAGAVDDPDDRGVDAAVIAVDTATNEVVRTIEVGGDVGADLTFLDGDLWVLLFGDESVDHRMEVVRMDPGTGEVVARIALESKWAHTIVAAGGRILVDDRGSVVSIDPSTNAAAVRAPVASQAGPVLWRGQPWVALADGFGRVDPLSGEVLDRSPELDQSRYALCCGFVAGDDRGLWFVGFDGRTGGGVRRLDLYDPDSGVVSELAELPDGNPVAMAVGGDGVWILNYEGTVTHLTTTP
jgi:Tol biopolymer transport system component